MVRLERVHINYLDALTAVSMLKDMADSEPEAAYHLGMFYKEDDPDSAFLWLQQASQRGYPAGRSTSLKLYL